MKTPSNLPKGVKEYGISFNTKSHPGFVKVVVVTIREDIMADDDTVNVDLPNDPLYKDLQQFVKANPR